MRRESIIERDRKIVEEIAAGKPRREIAERFNLSASRINQIYTQARYCGAPCDYYNR